MPDKDKIHIKDTRTIDAVTGKPLTDKNRLHSVGDKELLFQIIKGAKERNIDPYTALAISMQETNFGNSKAKIFYGNKDDQKTNVFQVDNIQSHGIGTDKEDWEIGLDVMAEKFKLAKKIGKTKDADVIQSYNGYGKIGGELDVDGFNKHMDAFYKSPQAQNMEDWQLENYHNAKKREFSTLPNNIYGIVATNKKPIDMNKTPIYGERVVNVRDSILKTNPEIQQMVKEVYGGEPIHVTNEHIEEAKRKAGIPNTDDFVKWFSKAKGKTIVPLRDNQ